MASSLHGGAQQYAPFPGLWQLITFHPAALTAGGYGGPRGDEFGPWAGLRVSGGGAPRVVVIGSGSLVRSLSYSIGTEFRSPAVVTILARSPGNAARIADVAAVRASLSQVPVSFQAGGVDLGSGADVERALGEDEPAAVVNCASYQSPWERVSAPSAWTDLVTAAGFGVALPLQAGLVVGVAETLHRLWPGCPLINACFPDAVNPVLRALDLPVFCGIGNIAILAAVAQAALGQPDQRDLRLLAHHVHLHAPDRGADEARIWNGSTELPDPGRLLAAARTSERSELNQIAGHAAARLLAALLAGVPLRTNVPGPLGLPGGYPVRIVGREIELRLPDCLDLGSAVAWNQRAAFRDGVVVSDGQVMFAPAAQSVLKAHLPGLAAGFPATDIRLACTELLELRRRLRAA
jgi:hypothetical protein